MAARRPTKSTPFKAESLSNLVQVETKEKRELAQNKKDYDEINVELRAMTIDNDADYKYASEVLRTIKSYAKEVDKKRKAVTDPLNTALKEFRSWYKPTLDVLEYGERILKDKIGKYALEKEEKRVLQMLKVAEASKAGDFDAAHKASQGISDPVEAKGITVTTKWDYEIVDFDKVPRDFLCMDEDAMKKHFKDAGKDDPEEIPGIIFKKSTGVIARR